MKRKAAKYDFRIVFLVGYKDPADDAAGVVF
jgi:hypothetical protein